MLCLIDNYDSFTWNLVQQIEELGTRVSVFRNDAVSLREVIDLAPTAVVLGSGPGRPRDAGICPDLLRELPREIPVLGVCLGHQVLVEHYGGIVERDPEPVHGRASPVHHSGDGLFAGLSEPFRAGRYHSLAARSSDLPPPLVLDAWTRDGVAMGVRHRELPRFGIQFHPESVLTPEGERVVSNFLSEVVGGSSGTERAK